MLIPRENIYSTLFATWQTALAGQVQFFTRRPDVYHNIGMDSMPALLQVERRETAMKASPNMPGYWRMEVQVLVYFATGADVQHVIPSQVINPILDRIESVLQPNPLLGSYEQYLGLDGVRQVAISGQIEIIEGLTSSGGVAEAIIPIEILALS